MHIYFQCMVKNFAVPDCFETPLSPCSPLVHIFWVMVILAVDTVVMVKVINVEMDIVVGPAGGNGGGKVGGQG